MHKSGPSERFEDAYDELATRARSILRWKIRYSSICVTTQSGHVILSGNVFSDFDREAAEQTVRKLTGVVELTNRIVTTSPLISKQRRAVARSSIPSMARKGNRKDF